MYEWIPTDLRMTYILRMAFTALNDWDLAICQNYLLCFSLSVSFTSPLCLYRFICSSVAFFITWWNITSSYNICSSISLTHSTPILSSQLNSSVISARKSSLIILFPPATQDYTLSLHPDLFFLGTRIIGSKRIETVFVLFTTDTSTLSLACSRCSLSLLLNDISNLIHTNNPVRYISNLSAQFYIWKEKSPEKSSYLPEECGMIQNRGMPVSCLLGGSGRDRIQCAVCARTALGTRK